MAINDLIGNKFFRIAGTLAALTVPYVVGCEGDSTTNKNYYGEGNGGSGGEYDCNTICENIKNCCETNYYDPEAPNVDDMCNSCATTCSNSIGKLTVEAKKCLATTCGFSDNCLKYLPAD